MRGLHQFALKIQERFFYGWVVAGVAALGMLRADLVSRISSVCLTDWSQRI